MSENYIVINGKRAELTKEQMCQLGIEVPKGNPFERSTRPNDYYYVGAKGDVVQCTDVGDEWDNQIFNVANYCADKGIMEQRALHETLSRLLWRCSMKNGGSEIDWFDTHQPKWSIACYPSKGERLDVNCSYEACRPGVIYFCTSEAAEAAIKEIVEPFMKEHPEFKW